MGMDAIPSDTTPDAFREQVAIARRLGPEGRIRLTLNLCEQLRNVLKAGIRSRHPEYDEETVKLAAARLTLGGPLFREAFPGIEVQP